jgi:Tfp pilus assembly protein PilE
MGVILSGTARSAATRLEAQSFCQRIAQSLDRFFAQRSRQAVATSLAQRCKYDIKRCRRLMSQASNVGKAPRKQCVALRKRCKGNHEQTTRRCRS